MATYETDFSEYTDDVQPSDWTERWHTTAGTSTVRAGTAVEHIGAKYLEQSVSTQRYGISWDDIDADADRDEAEGLIRFTQDTFSTATDFGQGIILRGSGDDTTENGYVTYIFESDELHITRYLSGSGLNLTFVQLGAGFLVSGEYYWLRFRVSGSDLKSKIWKDGEEEPSGWTVETTDSNITGVGWAAAWMQDGSTDSTVDFFSVGTNGDTAPFPPADTSVVIRSTQQPVEVLLQDSSPMARVTQVPVEVLLQDSSPMARVTQVAVEVLMQVKDLSAGSGSAHLIIAT